MADIMQRVVRASDALQDAFSSSHNLIPHMQWEEQLEGILAVSQDQLRFMLALFASVLVGAGLRLLSNPTVRHLYALATGVLLTYYPFGAGVVHAIPPALITYLGMLMAPKNCGTIAWVANFPYLIYLHVVNASGHNWMRGNMDFTGCQMVLVLKLVSVAMSYQDYRIKKKEDMTSFQAAHALAAPPSLLEYLSYVFSLGNLLAGPYFEFKEYKDFMEDKGVWERKPGQPGPSTVLPTVKCLAEVALFMGLYLRLLPIFNIETFNSKWYLTAPVYLKLAIIFVCGSTNQFKYCFAWKLSETSLTLAGLNYLGTDPQTGKTQWGRCRNVRFFHLITCDSARTVPTYWNIGTGQFLRRYVYERLVKKGRKPGFPQLLATQMISAVWHGLYAGYQLFFAGSAIWIYFSTLLYKTEQRYFPALSKTLPWRAAKIVWTNMVLNYMASAFMILDLKDSLELYRSVYYGPHLIMIAGCFIGPLLIKGKRPPKAATAPPGKTE